MTEAVSDGYYYWRRRRSRMWDIQRTRGLLFKYKASSAIESFSAADVWQQQCTSMTGPNSKVHVQESLAKLGSFQTAVGKKSTVSTSEESLSDSWTELWNESKTLWAWKCHWILHDEPWIMSWKWHGQRPRLSFTFHVAHQPDWFPSAKEAIIAVWRRDSLDDVKYPLVYHCGQVFYGIDSQFGKPS